MTGWDALFIFMLAAFAGYEVIGRVPVILHTPLMSGSNFVHGIVVVGSMVALGTADTNAQRAIGFIGVLLGAANAVGGYAVTDRMLEMFKSSGDARRGGQPTAPEPATPAAPEPAPVAAAAADATQETPDTVTPPKTTGAPPLQASVEGAVPHAQTAAPPDQAPPGGEDASDG